MNNAEKYKAAEDFLAHIRSNRESVGELLKIDAKVIRDRAAENGIELTPSECADLKNILQCGYNMVGGDDNWSDFIFEK